MTMKAGRFSPGFTPSGTRTVPASFLPLDVNVILASDMLAILPARQRVRPVLRLRKRSRFMCQMRLWVSTNGIVGRMRAECSANSMDALENREQRPDG